ncbi:hypothetical protein G3N56_11115 [Desulfovibrio sulfodismutans]|uniref:DUF4145 domain-containing protein n=1 Tax=Desulfolutivibrio sulfodismutans TaxID=63561 RepID=A0A7K3NM69_9BACT|nr:hypothetical protein [Desulfolutivibrio sulfodismutans]NDY57291.1 hypothetical protein [Desulfolutivibrio sulfodismutans]QLA13657.1 hypothetical protein GD606_16000 [Desulfolutivibrio sulfodismutans DSM 3696]
MDTLTFISSIIRDVSTPAAALIALWILLSKMPHLARFIKTIKFKDIEVNLREEIAKAKDEAEILKSITSAENGPQETTKVSAFDEKIIKLANIDPKAAIFEIWKQLENSILKLMQHNGLIRFTRPDKFIRWLGSHEIISGSQVDLFLRLKKIRNEAVHAYPVDSPDISISDVLEYKELVALLIQTLESIQNKNEYLDYPIPPAPPENVGP